MTTENGSENGVRNIGRFFLFAIPLVLGLGFSVWFGAFIGVAQYKHDLAQEKRSAIYVGAEKEIEEKIKIEVIPHDCTTITKADVKGVDLMMYARNDCRSTLSYLAWHWMALSPDGTAIDSGYTNLCPKPTLPGDKAECKLKISNDKRMAVLRLRTSKGTD